MLQKIINFLFGNTVPTELGITSDRSPQWETVRKKHLLKEPICQACGGTDNLQAHHIEPFHFDPSKELDESNLITLCEKSGHDCHFIFGHLYNFKDRYNVKVREDAKWWRDRVKQELETNKNIK